MQLVKGTCYQVCFPNMPAGRACEVVLYLGLSPQDSVAYPCDQCDKERTRLHWFVDACHPDNPHFSYKYGSECIRHLVPYLKQIPCPSASLNYQLEDDYT